MKSRVEALLKALGEGVYEKDVELSLGLLAALSGQSVLLLGPPGVAKSMVARRLKLAFADARSFEYLMSRFSTPDELFGPVSITRLKESDSYERAVEGYLPTADVVFLDEIWKAGPAIQNTLLTVINEKTYLNGNRMMHLPLKLLVAASNELPTQGEGLEALWDRFLLRLVCQPIGHEQNFYRMLAPEGEAPAAEPVVDPALPFTAEEYAAMQRRLPSVTIPAPVLSAITAIRDALRDVAVEGQDVHRTLYVSDRRWKKIATLLRASALMHDRTEVALADLPLAIHCLWNEPDEVESVGRIVADALFRPCQTQLDALVRQVGSDLRRRQVREALDEARMRGDHRDDDLVVFDGLYYGLDDGHSFLPVVDFKRLPTRSGDEPAVRGVMYRDPRDPRRTMLSAFTNPDNVGEHEAELTRVNLYRDSMNLYVNGNRYAMRRARRGEALQAASGFGGQAASAGVPLEQLEGAVDALFVEASTLARGLHAHLFASPQVMQLIDGRMDGFKRQIAKLRADVRKLIYDE